LCSFSIVYSIVRYAHTCAYPQYAMHGLCRMCTILWVDVCAANMGHIRWQIECALIVTMAVPTPLMAVVRSHGCTYLHCRHIGHPTTAINLKPSPTEALVCLNEHVCARHSHDHHSLLSTSFSSMYSDRDQNGCPVTLDNAEVMLWRRPGNCLLTVYKTPVSAPIHTRP